MAVVLNESDSSEQNEAFDSLSPLRLTTLVAVTSEKYV